MSFADDGRDQDRQAQSRRAIREDDPVMDCLWHAAPYDLTTPAQPLRRRMLAAVSDRILIEAHVCVAPVYFGSRLFHIDEEGIWAVLVPMTNEYGWIENIAAFDPNGPRAATLNLTGFAVGLEEIRLTASIWCGPRLHANVWSWLKAECCGLLPVDWRATALYLMERGVVGVVAPGIDSGRIIERRLHEPLTPPPVFVASAEVAA